MSFCDSHNADYKQALICTYVSIFACLHFGVYVVSNLRWHPYVLSCIAQSRSSLSFLPGSVLVFRAPPEGPLARWERCWRRPGPAALLPSPSAGCQAQRVPLASRAWQWDCLHSQRRVWTGQGVATSCWTHTCRKANKERKKIKTKHTHMHVHTSPPGGLLEGLTHVQKMLQEWEKGVFAGGKPQISLRHWNSGEKNTCIALSFHHCSLTSKYRTSSMHIDLLYYLKHSTLELTIKTASKACPPWRSVAVSSPFWHQRFSMLRIPH